jgi:type IV pilus assembly protein PilV
MLMTHLQQATNSRRRHAQSGLAILEVLIAVLLFSLGILGLLGLQARAVSFSIDAEDRNRAALLANDAASIMWLKKSVTLSAPDLAAWQERVEAVSVSGLPNSEGTIEGVAGTTNSADITIKWHRPSRDEDEQDSTFTTRVVLP